jgi:hypothetical protein
LLRRDYMRRISLLSASAIAVALSLPGTAFSQSASWGDFVASTPTLGQATVVPLGGGSTTAVSILAASSSLITTYSRGNIGAAETGLNYANLYTFGLIPRGGNDGNATTTIEFSGFNIASKHLRGFLQVSAVNGNSSPISVHATMVSGTAPSWSVVGTPFAYNGSNSSAISWNQGTPGNGTLTTSASIGNDSKAIVLDLGSLTQYSSITVSLNQSRADGIEFSLGEETSGDAITGVITADNAYGFGFGDENGIAAGNYFGGIRNLYACDIFNCPTKLVTSPPTLADSYQFPGFGPEKYEVSVLPSEYAYLIAWSDNSTTQGIIAGFQLPNGTLLTSDAWQVFATGINRDSDVVTDTLTAADVATVINPEIVKAKTNLGLAGTSIGWVDKDGKLPTGISGTGKLAVGEKNNSSINGPTEYFPIIQGISSAARWLWYQSPGDSAPFVTTSSNEKKLHIFRTQVSKLFYCPEGPDVLLSGSGTNLPNTPFLPKQSYRPPSVAPVYAGGSGSWSTPALPDWVGSFTISGPAIWSGTTSGTTTFNFSSLPNGSLPADTLITLTDFDGQTEQITLTAAGITGSWLSEPIAVFLDPSDTHNTVPAIAMPGWSLVNGAYTIDGSTVSTAYNPSVGFTLKTLVPLTSLTVNKPGATNFSIDAPTNCTDSVITSTTVISASAPVQGQVTFTVTVTGGLPTGTVQYKDNGVNIGSPVTLINGIATYTATIANGHTITATYSGDSNNASSTTAVGVVTGITSSTTVINASSTASGEVTFTATVTGNAPAGTVQFKGNGVNVGSPVTLINGTATFITTVVTKQTFTATYSGDSLNTPSTTAVGVVIAGTPNLQDVPTLPEWGMILLMALLFARMAFKRGQWEA